MLPVRRRPYNDTLSHLRDSGKYLYIMKSQTIHCYSDISNAYKQNNILLIYSIHTTLHHIVNNTINHIQCSLLYTTVTITPIAYLPYSLEVSQALGHLLRLHVHEAIVQPVPTQPLPYR